MSNDWNKKKVSQRQCVSLCVHECVHSFKTCYCNRLKNMIITANNCHDWKHTVWHLWDRIWNFLYFFSSLFLSQCSLSFSSHCQRHHCKSVDEKPAATFLQPQRCWVNRGMQSHLACSHLICHLVSHFASHPATSRGVDGRGAPFKAFWLWGTARCHCSFQ